MQKLDAELTNFAGPLGVATLKADDMGFGFNVGALFQATPNTRIGANYRSKIKYDLEGTIAFGAAPPGNGDIRADLDVPASFSVSAFSTLNSQWEVMADLTWTGWGELKRLDVVRTSNAATLGPTLPGAAGLRWTAFGGVPVHPYEKSPAGDWIAGAGTSADAWEGGRVSLEWVHIRDRLSLLGIRGVEEDDLVLAVGDARELGEEAVDAAQAGEGVGQEHAGGAGVQASSTRAQARTTRWQLHQASPVVRSSPGHTAPAAAGRDRSGMCSRAPE